MPKRILFSWSIRRKLLLLLLVIFLPASGIILVSGLDHRRHEIEEAENNALVLVRSLAAQQEQIAISTKLMLSTLAHLPEVQRLDVEACNAIFRELNQRHSFYSTIAMATPDGNLLAASGPFTAGSINLADRRHIQDAIRTLDFSTGEYIVGRQSRAQSLNYTFPVLNADSHLIAIVIAGFKLDEYGRLMAKANLPEDCSLGIMDHAGVRLYRLPISDAAPAGKPIPEDSFIQMSGTLEEGIFHRISQDGISRIYAFKQLRLREGLPPYLYIAIGMPKEKILHDANHKMLSYLSVLVTATLVSIFLAWIFSRFTLVAPINRLVIAARRFGEGEMGARTDLPHTSDELGQLARTFDEMASLLEKRDLERKQAEEALAKHGDHLEELVKERTARLEQINEQLQREIVWREQTQEKLMAAVLTAEEERAKSDSIIAALGDAIEIQDMDYRVLYQNRISVELAGDHRGEYCYAAFEGKDHICEECPVEMSYLDGLVHKMEKRVSLGGKEFFLELTASPLKDASGKIVAGVKLIRNLTDRKLREVELQEAKNTAEQASRAKGEFLANMSHEIRTPMSGIIGMLDLVLKTELREQQREFLTMARSSADSLLRLLNDIIDFSKIEAGRLDLDLTVFSLRKVMGDTLKSLAPQAHGKGLELIKLIHSDVPDTVKGDPGRLSQIVANLAGNAIKFTEKGEVVVRVWKESEGDDTCCLHFAIEDTGIGIPVEKQQIIFQSFTQADSSMTRRFGGTGLGLAISAHLVELMGGSMRVESEVGKGSIFHFDVSFGKIVPDKPALPLNARKVLEGLPVLIVDGNAKNREALSEMLAMWGIRPVEAESGKAAVAELEMAGRAGRPFSLVLLDPAIPDVQQNLALTETIAGRLKGSGEAILMLSATDILENMHLSKNMPLAGHLRKPITHSELLGTLLRALGYGTAARNESPSFISSVSRSHHFQRLRALVVEDNPVLQMLVSEILKDRGHDIAMAVNGKEALALFQREVFDVVLMDIQMPEMDGYEATKAIRDVESRRGGKPIPIVAMTAHALKGDREKCIAAGMNDYISKPIRPDRLIEMIEKHSWSRTSTGYGLDTFALTEEKRASRMETDRFSPEDEAVSSAFDSKVLLELADGKADLMKKVIFLFLDQSRSLLLEVRSAIEQGDARRLERSAHTLKGSVGNFEVRKAWEAALLMEGFGRDADLASARLYYDRLVDHIERLSRDLSAFMPTEQQGTKPQEAAGSVEWVRPK